MGIIYYDNTSLALLRQDIFLLIKDNNFNRLSLGHYPHSMINHLFSIHDIDHYRTFLHHKNGDMSILHILRKILEYNPEVNSKFRSMILHNMISSHFDRLSEFVMSNLKKA
jgi:hypothetical protein